MRMRTLGIAFAVVAVGYMILTAPDLVGLVLMVCGAVWFWRVSRRSGVRR
ncbi:hypothetical protein ACTD5D_31460 [Nocardia takedensis]